MIADSSKEPTPLRKLQKIIVIMIGVQIAISVMIVIILLAPILPVNATILVGNISDGVPRLAISEEEGMSVSVYEMINGITRQIGGFDNLTELVQEFLIPRVEGQVQFPQTDPNPFQNMTLGTQGNMTGALDEMNQVVQELDERNATAASNQQLAPNTFMDQIVQDTKNIQEKGQLAQLEDRGILEEVDLECMDRVMSAGQPVNDQ